MNKKNNKIKTYLITAFLLVGILYPSFFALAATFNNSPQDFATLRVTNYTRNPNCSNCWQTSVSADPGDIVSFAIYYHNTSNETANQTRIRVNLPSNSATYHTATAYLWASNAPTVSGSATVNLSSNQTLTFVPGSVRWYPNQSTSNSTPLPYGQDGSELFTSNGLNIGNIAPGWATQGSVVFWARVGNTPSGAAPTVSTYSASSISQNSATLNGSVNPNNSYTYVWFEYGTSQSLGYTVGYQSVGSGNSSVNVSYSLANLQPNTTYYYRMVGQNSYGTTYGNILSFTTSGSVIINGMAPTVTTLQATYIYQNSALLNGLVNPHSALTNAWFEWGTTPSLGRTTILQPMGAGNNNYNYSYALSGLVSNTTYYYRAVAQNSYGTTYGNILSFTTVGSNIIYQPSVISRPTTPSPTVIIRETVVSGERPVELAPSLDTPAPKAGDKVNLTVVYRNLSSKPITNSVLKIILPNEVSYVSSNPSYTSREGNLLIFNLGRVEARSQSSVNVEMIINRSVDKGTSLIFTAIFEYNDANNKFQTVSAYLTATVKEGISLFALVLSAFAGLFKTWWFDLLLGLIIGLLIYHFFIKKKKSEKEELEPVA